MVLIFSIITLILFVLTLGCGFAIYFGGEEFKNAVKGHMILGVLTLLSAIISFVLYIISK